MAAFAKTGFNTATYAAFRPTYPRQLFDFVFQYHGRIKSARWDTAVDLGCGTGQATTGLTPFKRVVGVDPSSRMLEGARRLTHELGGDEGKKYEFVQAVAEDLRFLQDGSVDMIVSAQAGHWYDWHKVWPECARVLRKDGSAAFWGYSEFRLTRYPSLSPLITQYSQGTDKFTSIGPYWEQPGRSILDNHLLDVPDPTTIAPGMFGDFERVFFTGDHHPSLPSPRPVILRKSMTWTNLLAYFRTQSSLYAYKERFPQDSERPDGDIAQRFCKSLKEGVSNAGGQVGAEDQIEVEWPTAVILARRI